MFRVSRSSLIDLVITTVNVTILIVMLWAIFREPVCGA